MNSINKTKGEIVVCLLLVLLSISVYAAQPRAPASMVNTSTESPQQSVGSMVNITGGTISTISFNATTQNPRWKGFVGDIDGSLALLDSSLNALFSWDIQTVTGEIYVTRSPTIPDWDSIACATDSIIESEQNALNITSTELDSINNTFSTSAPHNSFYAGTVQISANSCPAIALNVNNTQQTTDFQETLLTDSSSLIYSSLLENSTYGFNDQLYDFQMIVAENALEGNQPNTAYYFYVELI